jgi:hypothetical protein
MLLCCGFELIVLGDMLIAKKPAANPLIYKAPKTGPLVPRPQEGRRRGNIGPFLGRNRRCADSPKPQAILKIAGNKAFWCAAARGQKEV